MTFLGIWACQWRELRPISFGGSSRASQHPSGPSSSFSPSGLPQGGDEGQQHESFSRGRGRGRNLRDDGEEYEMVQMKGDEEVV